MSRLSALLVVFLVLGGVLFGGGQGDGQTTLRVMIVERAEVPQDQGRVNENPWTEYVQSRMAQLGIDVRYVPVGGSLVRHTVMMATNTAPDLAFTHGRLLFMKFAADGGLHDLGVHIPEYGPNIPAVLGEDHLKLGQIDGIQYAIPSRREIDSRYASFIRKDWLDALGLEVPTNRTELTQVLRAFRDQNPGNVIICDFYGGETAPPKHHHENHINVVRCSGSVEAVKDLPRIGHDLATAQEALDILDR